MRHQKTLTSWVVMEYDTDVAQWVAHSLDLDVLAQGEAIKDALENLAHATLLTYMHDTVGGLRERRAAPQELWRLKDEVVNRGRAAESLAEIPATVRSLVLNLKIEIEIEITTALPELRRAAEPPRWTTQRLGPSAEAYIAAAS